MKSLILRLTASAVLLAASLGLTSCVTTQPGGAKTTSFSFDPPVTAPTGQGRVKMNLSLSTQHLYVTEGDKVLLASPVCVGTAHSPTPQGSYTIYNKEAHRRRQSEPGAGYPMTYWVEFKPAYGFHWGFVKPYPATHGCVRMPVRTAKKVFDLVSIGTPVNISTTQPWDSTVGAQLPVLDDSHLPDPPMSYMLSPKVFTDAQQGKMWNF